MTEGLLIGCVRVRISASIVSSLYSSLSSSDPLCNGCESELGDQMSGSSRFSKGLRAACMGGGEMKREKKSSKSD